MVLLECKPDETLVRYLGVTKRNFYHQNDKGRVCNMLAKKEGHVAMIDEDPGSAQPVYLRTLSNVSDEDGIRVLRDETRAHRVVILRPRLEEWIIETASIAGVKMEDFGLSNRGNELHREINSRLENFTRLLGALDAAGSKRLGKLRTLITG